MNGSKMQDAQQAGMNILVVDDEPMLRSVIVDFLTLLGFDQYHVACDGLEALQVIRTHPIDLMVSDMRMPKMELEELLGVLRKEFPDVIVVATSGYSDFDSAVNIFANGAHDFLGKPLNLDSLETSLRWIIRRHQILTQAAQLIPAGWAWDDPRMDEALAKLKDLASGFDHPFSVFLDQCLRVAALAEGIDWGLTKDKQNALILSGLLHELGTSHQMYQLCRESRKLEENERRLIHAHSLIGGRLVAKALGRAELETVIGQHLMWQKASHHDAADWSFAQDCSVWLGLLNCVDGCLSARADRPQISAGQLHSSLAKRYDVQPIPNLQKILQKWPQVEAHYNTH